MVLRDGRERNQRPQYRKKKYILRILLWIQQKTRANRGEVLFLKTRGKSMFYAERCCALRGRWPRERGSAVRGMASTRLGRWVRPAAFEPAWGQGQGAGQASCSPPRTGKHMKRAWAPESGSKLGLQWPGNLPPGCLYLSGVLPAPCCALGLEWGFQHVGPWGTLI